LQNSLDTQLPQRIDQARSAALNAYAQYRDRLAEIERKDKDLLNKLVEIDPARKDDTLEEIKEAVLETSNWIDRIGHYKVSVRGTRPF
ncbi:MAG: hypothetical protein QGG19_20380, partial [Alphaproteobacteria bacterium]|nr:hypothetical protein [Alphaproteobacteria bacterium]